MVKAGMDSPKEEARVRPPVEVGADEGNSQPLVANAISRAAFLVRPVVCYPHFLVSSLAFVEVCAILSAALTKVHSPGDVACILSFSAAVNSLLPIRERPVITIATGVTRNLLSSCGTRRRLLVMGYW